MSIFERIAAGSTQATTMFKRLGIDEETVLGSDPIRAGNELRRRALACTFCKGGSECAHLLATGEKLRKAPAYCPNKQELDALARG